MTTATAPAVVRAASLPDSIKVEQLTCAIGAELSNVNLGVASRDRGLVAEIRALLLKHRADITVAEFERVAIESAYPKLIGQVVPAGVVAEVQKLRDEFRARASSSAERRRTTWSSARATSATCWAT